MKRNGRQTIMREYYACLLDLGGCGAPAGESCISKQGFPTAAHAARWDQYLRVPASQNRMNARIKKATYHPRSTITMGEKLELDKYDGYPSSEDFASAAADAIDNASDQDKMTWITDKGKPVAAIVPVETAELAERIGNPAYLIRTDSSHPIRLAEKIEVRRLPGGQVRMWIDGRLFEYGTLDGFTVAPRRLGQPGVSLTIAAMRVEVSDGVMFSEQERQDNSSLDAMPVPGTDWAIIPGQGDQGEAAFLRDLIAAHPERMPRIIDMLKEGL